jgi:hypothetical protein
MGLTVAEAAEALMISQTRLIDNLYVHDRPPSHRTSEMAIRLEVARFNERAKS